jgi:hypothetical protein
MKIANIVTGPHVQGVIRFSHSGQAGANDFQQHDNLQILARHHKQPALGQSTPQLECHPLDSQLRSKAGSAEAKLQSIPVKLVFDSVEANLSGKYRAYDGKFNRVTCSGDGEKATRINPDGQTQAVECKGPQNCDYACSGAAQCSLDLRLRLQIEGQNNELDVFEFQSTSIHSYAALSAKLQMLKAYCGGLAGAPLNLTIWAKSGVQSEFESFFCVNLNPANSLSEVKSAVDAFKEANPNWSEVEAVVASMASDIDPFDAFEGLLPVVVPASAPVREALKSKSFGSVGGGTESIMSIVEGARSSKSKPVSAAAEPARDALPA